MTAVDFYFDYSCPFAYVASTRIEALVARAGGRVQLKPVLLGGILNALNGTSDLTERMSAPKARHNVLDMHRWAAVHDVPFRFNPTHPNRTLTALRATLAHGEPFGPLMHAFFRAYWVEGRDLSDPAVVADVLRGRGLDAETILARAQSDAVKAELRARTDAAIAQGVFGVPTMRVRDTLYWGQDRLEAVGEAVYDCEPTAVLTGVTGVRPDRTVELWFDYSSPYSYLAAMRAPSRFGAALRWRPMLLGAVFKELGGPMVPLFAMSESKRTYARDDMARQADDAGADIRWPSRFPLNTVTLLRATLAAAERADAGSLGRLIQHIFVQLWQHDRDPQDPELIREACAAVGLDGGAVLEAATSPAGKQALRDATAEAVASGVFGAPTWTVHAPGHAPALFWGNDRMGLALRAAGGDDRLLEAGRER